MRHYLFELRCGEYEGEQFLVGADNYDEARERAVVIARSTGSVNGNGIARFRYCRELTNEEAKISILNEY